MPDRLSGPPPACSVSADLAAAVHALAAEVQRLSGVIERLQRPAAALSRADRGLLADLLPAIAGALGSQLFTTRELFEGGQPALAVVTASLNTRQVGRLLKRAEGQPIAGYMVQRDGEELHMVLWRVVQVPEFLGDTNLTVPPARAREVVE